MPSGGGSLFEYHPKVLTAVETTPSACQAPQLSLQAETKIWKISSQVEYHVVLCGISLYSSPSTATYLPFREINYFIFPLSPTQYVGRFGGSLPSSFRHQGYFWSIKHLTQP